jgi:hypothetical protein
MRFTNKKAILFGLENSYGVDPMLVAADALQVMNFQMVPFQATMANRDTAQPSYGADAEAPVGLYRTVTFDIFLSGSGAAGTPPLWGPVARSCDMLETVTEDTDTTYTLVDGGSESGALYFFLDGQRRKMLGAKGTLTPKFTGGALLMASVAMSGLCTVADADAAFPTRADIVDALADFVPALEVNKVNTSHTLHGHASVLESLELQQGGTVIFRDRPNAAYVAITGRRSTGTCVIDAPTLTAKNHGAIFQARTTGAQQIVHGTVAGNIVQFDAPAVQIGAPADTDISGVPGLSLPLLYTRASGAEWSLTVK